MAKKKSKAQRREERRRAMARKRRETGWQPPPAPDWEQEQLVADMFPVLAEAEEAGPEEGTMLSFMALALDSGELIEQPEFDGVYANPLLCVEAFGWELEEQGLEEVDPEQLDTEEQEKAYQGLIEGTVRQTLTPELQEAILSALRDLRQRAQEEGDAELKAQSAAVYAFLDGMGADEVWVNVGVVQALVQRSLDAGIGIYDVTQEAAERAMAGGGIPGLLRRLTGAVAEQTMDDVLAKYPGLAGFLTEDIETRWQQGVDALASGKLDLGLFDEAEVSVALDKARSLGLKLTTEGALLVAGTGSEEEKVQAFASWLSSYVEELAAPPRLARMQARLDEFAGAASPSQLTFLSLLNEEFEEADGPDRLLPVLERALAGEMQNTVLDSGQVEG
jgi:hypothetical protein